MNPLDAQAREDGVPVSRRSAVRQIVRVTRVVSDLERSRCFYCDALGFRLLAGGPLSDETKQAFGIPGVSAQELVLRLCQGELALVEFQKAGLAYPEASHSDDLWFQHLAILVSDMDRAYAHLRGFQGWLPITLGGPQTLPAASGGGRAFKFRDPDGHPLELLWRAARSEEFTVQGTIAIPLFLGIDHSAIAISSTRRSRDFYEALGFNTTHATSNQGVAQSRLDDVHDAAVRVTRLDAAPSKGLGLELLAYLPPGRASTTARLNDRVTDWMTLDMSPLVGIASRDVFDPDHHRLLLVYQWPEETGAAP